MTAMDPPEDDDRWIDRLVDGELPAEARRALLGRLDASPDGWRRCALAFLEAQAWREGLARHDGDSLSTTPPSVPAYPARRPAFGRTAAALAAGLLASFTLGWMSRGVGVEVRDAAGPAPGALAKADAPGPPASGPGVEDPGNPSGAVPREDPEPEPPDPVVSRLESRGYRVDRRQRVLALETEDGRRLAMPVEEVRVRYIGDRTY